MAMYKKSYLLTNLPQMKAEDVFVFKKALEQYYIENKKYSKLKMIPNDDITLEIGVELASESGYTILDTPNIITLHLKTIIETNLDKVFSYQNSKSILSEVENKNPALVEDVLQNMKFIDSKYILTKLITKKYHWETLKKYLN